MRHILLGCAVAVALATLACPPAVDEVTAETVAGAFGLIDGRVMHYAVTAGTSSTEDHKYTQSSSYDERLVITRTEFSQGWIRDAADGYSAVTDFEATAQQVQIVKMGDGVPRQAEFSQPIPVASYPWTKNARLETTVTATVSDASGTSQHSERHTFIVSNEGTVSTGEGELQVFELSWQRVIDSEPPDSAMLYLAPGLGLARIDRFEGASLELRSHEN